MRIILWGATGQAVVLHELYARLGVAIDALFENDRSRKSPLEGVPLYYGAEGFAEWFSSRATKDTLGLAAIGGDRGRDRLEIQRFFQQHSVPIATAVHPAAFTANDCEIGEGSQVLAMSAVGARARLGMGCIVNTADSVDHECTLGDGVHIGPGAVLAGVVNVERYAFVGAGATVLPRLTIGEGAIVGAASVVVKDVEPNVVVVGNPARVLRRL